MNYWFGLSSISNWIFVYNPVVCVGLGPGPRKAVFTSKKQQPCSAVLITRRMRLNRSSEQQNNRSSGFSVFLVSKDCYVLAQWRVFIGVESELNFLGRWVFFFFSDAHFVRGAAVLLWKSPRLDSVSERLRRFSGWKWSLVAWSAGKVESLFD